MKLDNIRKEYNFSDLTRNNINENPIDLFKLWIKEAIDLKVEYPTGMSLITMGTSGFPESRIVLLKDFGEKGFTFFTNYKSEKAKAIDKNNAVGLHFFWPDMERQVRISGYAAKTSKNISEEYFYSRPKLSQIAAIISEQSREVPSRNYLEDKFDSLLLKLQKQNPKRPLDWGGYIVVPEKIEFWQGRESRLHDRILFEKVKNKWIMKRLAP